MKFNPSDIKDSSRSGGFICIKADDNQAEYLETYCINKNLEYKFHEEFNSFQIVLWRSRPFTKTGDFKRNGFIGKAQQYACNKLGDEVIADLT
jgi:hypothetical protein